MKRAFPFKPTVRLEARFRQNAKCACCGDRLRDVEEHAHHVVPNQSGLAGNPEHAWLASAENCVVLCATCHERVHQDGRYRTGAVAPPGYYPYSHGGNYAAHHVWAQKVEQQMRTVWP